MHIKLEQSAEKSPLLTRIKRPLYRNLSSTPLVRTNSIVHSNSVISVSVLCRSLLEAAANIVETFYGEFV
jgi:hypothetical protein